IVLRRAQRRAVVVVTPPVPLPVPGPLEHARQPAGLARVTRRPRRVPGLAQGDELLQHRVQEPPEPDAFAAALVPDPVHPVVPIATADQRKAVGASRKALVDGAHTMVEEGSRFGGTPPLPVGLRLPGGVHRSLQERTQSRQLRSWYMSHRFMRRSKESSGVRTWTVSRVSAQNRCTASKAMSAAATPPWRRTSSRACS